MNEKTLAPSQEELTAMASDPKTLGIIADQVEKLRGYLIGAFKRLAEQNNTTEDKIQMAIRFKDLPDATGELFYQLMINWKPARELSFNRDFLGLTGEAAMFGGTGGEEALITGYLLGADFLGIKIEGALSKIGNKHMVPKWSYVSGIFYKKTIDSEIKLAIYVYANGENKIVETIDLFKELFASEPESSQEE